MSDFDFDAFEREIMRQADELTPELLPRLLMMLLKRDSLVHCPRHMTKLFPYVRAQIALTRAKRNYYRDAEWRPNADVGSNITHAGCDFGIVSTKLGPETLYFMALEHRDRVRREYRSTPCVCFQQHR